MLLIGKTYVVLYGQGGNFVIMASAAVWARCRLPFVARVFGLQLKKKKKRALFGQKPAACKLQGFMCRVLKAIARLPNT